MRFVFAAVLCSLPTLASAAEIKAEPFSDGKGLIFVIGELKSGDENELKIKMSQYGGGAVVLAGPGGSLWAAIEMGKTIRLRQWHTWVPKGVVCASACALAWLGGVNRFMYSSSLIGFHAASKDKKADATANALLGAYLADLGLPTKAIFYITMTGPESLTMLSLKDARDVGIDVREVEEGERDQRAPLVADARTSAIAFLDRYYQAISSDNQTTIRFLSEVYADSVTYFGKQKARAEVLDQTSRFMDRWPQRSYRVHRPSLSVVCEGEVCLAKGVLDYVSMSQLRDRRSSGRASFEIGIRFAGPSKRPIIVSENGEVLARNLENLSRADGGDELIAPWQRRRD